MTDKPTAKAVAKELDRIHRRRRLAILGGWAVLVILAALYLRCGRGWGLGGGNGSGAGSGSGAANAPAVPHHCQVRVTAKGLELEGKPSTQGTIVASCPQGADVVVTGDARQGDWDALKAALDAAHVPVFVR
jgi:hypothetical protein